jgi:hypothetical protein
MSLKNRDILNVSTYITWQFLHENGYSFQNNRIWVDTGRTIRMRKDGPVEVEVIDRIEKKQRLSHSDLN